MGKHRDRRTCQRKTKYPNQTAAVASARKHDRPMRTYPCSVCGGWHLATKGKGAERDRLTRLSVGLSG